MRFHSAKNRVVSDSARPVLICRSVFLWNRALGGGGPASFQPRLSGCVHDQLGDGFMTGQRPPPPVLDDMRCLILFNLVVPGGRRHSRTGMPSRMTRRRKATFHSASGLRCCHLRRQWIACWALLTRHGILFSSLATMRERYFNATGKS